MGEIEIEVVYALPQRQWVLQVRVPEGSTIAQAIEISGIAWRVPQVTLAAAAFGVFGEPKPLDHVLRAGDRVEIYRPLAADPKDVRRSRAAASVRRRGNTR
jgi:putative ubiquitin-RnfH superfamily antitoxin RatB of RatAB toxin-antitoxin module